MSAGNADAAEETTAGATARSDDDLCAVGRRPRAGCLHVVATPIGNLADITLRALDILRHVDLVAAEDTRHSRVLLTQHGIPARLVAAHEHNERAAGARIVEALRGGQSVALVSDAGTPGISDPGARVVAAVREAGLAVIPVPGPSALAAALSVCGFDTSRVLFHGFLPPKAAARRATLETLTERTEVLVFYEAPHRVLEMVADLAAALDPQRPLFIARELTKRFETLHLCPLGEAQAWLAADANRQRGEFVLVVGPQERPRGEVDAPARRTLEILLRELPLKQAVALACEISGAPRKPLYDLALALAGRR